jgi:hypothetical protein
MAFSAATMGQMSMIGQIGGAATSAIGSYNAAASQKSALKASAGLSVANASIADSAARIAESNARVLDIAAASEIEQGQRQVGALTLQAGKLKSSQRAAMAANGIDLGTGSAAEVQASAEIMKQIDVNTLTANAVRSSMGYRMQATNARTQAANARGQGSSFLSDAAARNAAAAGINPAGSLGTSLMGSATSVASSWYSMNKPAGDVATASGTSDPIGTLGASRGWWSE